MTATVAEMGRPKKGMKTKTIRVDEDLAYKIGVIASAHDQQVPDWFSQAIRGLVEREYERAIKIIEAKKSRRSESP